MTDVTLAPGMPPLPDRFRRLPLDHRGYPVPKFVWLNPDTGRYDFRVVKPGWLATCIRLKRCWLCGEPLGRLMCFAIGPMCVINRNTSEPPEHRECGEFAVQACPFLRFPNRKRDEEGLPEDHQAPGGKVAMIMRNPGVMALWITTSYRPYRAGDSVLIEVGDPVEVAWWAHGRKATRAEVLASIESGMPILREMATKEGPEASKLLDRLVEAGMKLVPP